MALRDLERELFTCLERGDLQGAVEVVTSLTEAGAGGVEEVIAALASVQRQVGERWQRNLWTVAQEHAATAISDRALATVAARIDEPAVHGPVILTCAEGEWHTLPARMFTDGLRARRWAVRFLGGSIPPRTCSGTSSRTHRSPWRSAAASR